MSKTTDRFVLDLKALLGLSDDELALAIYGLFVELVAGSKGYAASDLSDKSLERLAKATLEIRAKSQSGSVLASGFTMIIEGDPEGAGVLFRDHFKNSALLIAALDELNTGTRRQSRNAKRDRGDHLTQLIRRIVTEADGQVSTDELWQRLLVQGDESYWRVEVAGKSQRIIQSDTEDPDSEDEISYLSRDGTGLKSANRKAIANRLSRVKKKFRRNVSR